MTNIHVIPTNKPSRLHKFGDCFDTNAHLQKWHNDAKPEYYNIYITSDEKIVEGDFGLGFALGIKGTVRGHFVFKQDGTNISKLLAICGGSKKIIITTDEVLILEGVQKIDDAFLEWFVKNPNCEKVDIFYSKWYLDGKMKDYYKALIPKKEKCICENPTDNTCNYCNQLERKQILLKAELSAKQETLEEFAERIAYDSTEENKGFPSIKMVIKGAKWQQERSYSEAIDLFITEIKTEFKDDNWDYLEFIKERVVEQFKKK